MFPSYINQVLEFHQTFEHPAPEQPITPAETNWQFRHNFLLEEVEEYREACENNDTEKAFDSLLDIIYVAVGAGVQQEFTKIFDAGFADVHRANMSKACSTMDEVNQTLAYYEGQGVDVSFKTVGTKFIVYRTTDGKVLKNRNWSEPNLTPFLSEHAA